MPGTTVEEVLGATNLIGMIQGIISQPPTDLLPPSAWASGGNTKPVDGNTGQYTRVDGDRKTARLVRYGAPSLKRELKGLSEQAVTLVHSYEHEMHLAPTLMNLMAEDSVQKQRMGAQTVARQVADFANLFKNLRVGMAFSTLCLGHIYFDSAGNLLPSATGAAVDVDFAVPAAHRNQLNVFGTGNLISASWATAGTDIPLDIQKIRAAARKEYGAPLKYAFYGENIPSHFAGNTRVAALLAASPRLAEQVAAGDLPDPLFKLSWRPISEAFFEDSGSVLRDWATADMVVFTPEFAPEWWEWLEGTFPIPTSINVSADAVRALSSFTPAQGAFSYATITDDPPGVKHYGGDTVLCVQKVPKATYIADVVP